MTWFDSAHWQQLSQLLDEMLELPPAARAERLRALAQEDDTLASELAVLVAAHAKADDEQFLAGVADAGDAAPHGEHATLAGQRLGAYTLVSMLGQGGTGSAWLARRDDGRYEGRVAIKLLHLSLLGRAQAERFRREGAILARLSHPNIARLLDAGVSEAGQPYLVLELVDGERIDRWCDANALTIEQRLDLFDDVLAAVAHAHSHLVVHRDIKPTNILVDRDGRVKLLDFGIAKFVEEQSPAADSTLTQEGGHSFTPEYAAPEQWRGETPTTATDVYALGVLLHHLLVGRHPTSPPGANAQQAMRATLDVDPVPLSRALESDAALAQAAATRTTTAPKLARALRGDLEHIVLRALRKAPRQRYPTVDALAEDLRRLRAHEPVSARAGAWAYRTGKFLRRHRVGVTAGALASVVALVGAAGTLWQAQRAEKERDRAMRQFTQAEAVEEFMTFLLAGSEDRAFTTTELLDRGTAVADVQFADDPGAAARLQFALSGIYSEIDAIEKTGELLAKALASAKRAGDLDLQAQIECAAAAEVALEADNARATARFERALASVESRGGGGDAETLAYCHHTRALRAFEVGDYALALADEHTALALLGTPRPGNRTLQIAMRQQLAGALSKTGDLHGAIEQMQGAIAELQAMGRLQTVGAQTVLNNLGVLLVRAGQPLRALATFDRALAAHGAISDSDESTPALSSNRAKVLADLGRGPEGQQALDHSLAVAAARGDTRSPPFSISNFAWCPPGQLDACERRLAEARRQLEAILPPGHAALATSDLSLARMALAQGEPARARAPLERALALYGDSQPVNPERIGALAQLARVQLQLGDATAALALAERAVRLGRAAAAGFESTSWLGQALLAQGRVLRHLGDPRADAVLAEAAAQLDGSLGPAAETSREAHALLAHP
jgi:serine/threonine-protein kinase